MREAAQVFLFLFVYAPVLLLQAMASRLMAGTIEFCKTVDPFAPNDMWLSLAQHVTHELPPALDEYAGVFTRTPIPRAADNRWLRENDIHQVIELYHTMLRDNVSPGFADGLYVQLLGSLDALSALKHPEARRLWGDPELYSMRLIRPEIDPEGFPERHWRREVADSSEALLSSLLEAKELVPDTCRDLLESPAGPAGPYPHRRWESPFVCVQEATVCNPQPQVIEIKDPEEDLAEQLHPSMEREP